MSTIPLFPLGTVLFPGGLLPLQIFEVRYLDMVQRCHAEGSPFGVVCLTQGHEVQQPDGHGAFQTEHFHAAGTLAHIEQLERPQPGLLRIRCRGGQRFALRSREKLRHGLWVGSADVWPADADVPVPQDLKPLSGLLQDLAGQLRAQHPDAFAHALTGPQWEQAGWVANRWCELLPAPADVKQGLMVLDNPLLRLELVGDMVDNLPRAAQNP